MTPSHSDPVGRSGSHRSRIIGNTHTMSAPADSPAVAAQAARNLWMWRADDLRRPANTVALCDNPTSAMTATTSSTAMNRKY